MTKELPGHAEIVIVGGGVGRRLDRLSVLRAPRRTVVRRAHRHTTAASLLVRDQIEIGLQIPIPTVEPLPDRFPVSQSAQRVSGDQSQAFLPVVALWRPLPFPLHVARQLLQMLERNFVVFVAEV